MAATLQSIRDNLNELERRYTELDHLMADPAVATEARAADRVPEVPLGAIGQRLL